MTNTSASAALRAVGLQKRYREGMPLALRGVDLVIDEGSFVSIMGPSGSGKSTLLHLSGGLDRPTAGSVWWGDVDLGNVSDRELTLMRRTEVGFVFQSFNLVPVLSAADNVALPAVIAKQDRRTVDDRVHELLELVGLSGHEDKLPSEMSGGEQQRVAIARALLPRPRLLLADEPTGNLDSVTGATVLGMLQRARSDLGTTVVMVTHDAGAAARADKVVLLRDGEVHGDLVFGADDSRATRTEAVLGFLGADLGLDPVTGT